MNPALHCIFRGRLLLATLLALASTTRAQTVFTLTSNGDWTTTTIWSPNGLPGASDTAQINSSVNVTVSDARNVGILTLSAGSVTGGGTLTLNLAGSTWSGGILTGTGTLAIGSNASLALSGAANKLFFRGDGNGSGGRQIDNFGTVSWSGTGNLLGGDGGAIVNRAGALFDLQSDATLGFSGAGATPSFANAGTFRKSAGTGTSTVSQTAFTNTGLVAVQTGTLSFTSGVTSNAGTFDAGAGATLTFTGGQTFNTGTAFTGAGSILLNSGQTTLSGAIATQNLTFAGGTLVGTATVSGTLNWTAGDWISTGTLTVQNGSLLNLSGSADKRYARSDGNSSGGRRIENHGDIVWTGTGNVVGGDGGQIINHSDGRFFVRTDAGLSYSGAGSQPAFTNSGLLRKENTTGTTSVALPFVAAGGTVDVQAGTLAFTNAVTSNAGTFATAAGTLLTFSGGQTFNDGTTLNAAGNLRILSGNTVFSGAINSHNLEFAGGSATGTAAIAGSLEWTAGTWSSTGTFSFQPGSTLTLSGTAAKTVNRADVNSSGGRAVQTAGVIKWLDAGTLVGNDGAGFSVLPGGTFEIRNDSSYSHGGAGSAPFFTNAGILRKVASTGTTTFNSIVFTNNAQFELLSGTLTLAGSHGLSNNGNLSIASGATLISAAGGATSDSGTYDVSSGGLLRFTGGTNTINNSTFTGSGLTEVAGGILLVNATDLAGKFRLLSGTVGGSGNFSVGTNGHFTWSGGNLAGTGSLIVGTTGELLIDGAAAKNFFRGDGNSSGGRTISNFGQVTWADNGSVLGGDGAQFTNQIVGTVMLTGNASFGYTGAGAPPVFSNSGTVRKTAGDGISEFARTFNNTGTLESQIGTVRIAGGGNSSSSQFKSIGGEIVFSNAYTFNTGTQFLGASYTRLTGGTHTTAGTVNIGSTSLIGRVALEGGAISGGGLLRVDALGKFDWAGGALLGTGILRIVAGGEMFVLNSVAHDFARADGNSSGGRIIENGGTVAWAAGDIRGGDGASFVNTATGLFNITGNGAFSHTGAGATPSFSNDGIVRKTSAATTTFSQTAITTTGTFEVQAGTLHFGSGVTSHGGSFIANSGTTLTFGGGQTFNTGTSFSGAGLIQAIAGPTTVSGALSASHFVFAGGTLQGTATLTGFLEWIGGSFAGNHSLGIPHGSTLSLTGSGNRTFFRGDGNSSGGRTIENFGTLLVDHAGDFLGGDGAQILNRAGGLVELRNDRTLGFTGAGAIPSFTNEGTLRKTNGTGVSLVSQTNVFQNGLVEVQTGTLRFTSGVTSNAGHFNVSPGAQLEFGGGQTFNNGTSFVGFGLTRVTGGTTNVAGNLTLADFEFAGGNLVGQGVLSAGQFRWTGGDLRGSQTLAIATNASLVLTGAGDRLFLRGDGNSTGGRTIENFGLLAIENNGNFFGNDGAHLVNRNGGVIQLRNDATFGHGGAGAAPSFTNEGVLMKTMGTGTSTIAAAFTNTGTITVSTGALAFTSSFTNTNGAILLTGGSLSVTGPLNMGTAPLAGSGTITATTVTAGGVVSPGTSPGLMNIAGNFTLLGTSMLLLEIGGINQGTDFDFVNVSGNGALAGTLSLSFLDNFQSTVQSANTFTVLNATSGLTGAFANVANGQRLFTADGAGSFQVNYGLGSAFAPNSVVLSAFQPIPEPSTYVLLGLGVTAVIWRTRRRRN